MSTKNAIVSFVDDSGIVLESTVTDISPKRLLYRDGDILEVLNKRSETMLVISTDRLLSIKVVEVD
ncbi:hypothetical protein pKMKP103_CDS0173 [Klebsiella phage pKMKP103]|uniref:Uncharacterized protein n=1 Tax=Klebsiella phage JIPh_Kp127 TaxID=2653645 RepID=A0A5P8PL80_9CAUD|nr:hypothetical protein JIPhKp127_0097 [Klebsiella phage JIPh_Kp127]WOZ53622.1 hypothetical protein pKMKP103_CDS0173 [Klebsiella phage pKMKP103]